VRLAGRLTPQALRVRIKRDIERVAALIERVRHGVAGPRSAGANVFWSPPRGFPSANEPTPKPIAPESARPRADCRICERARRATLALIERRTAGVARSGQVLAALSYHGVLARGFALVRDAESKPLRYRRRGEPGARSTSAQRRARRGDGGRQGAEVERPVKQRPRG